MIIYILLESDGYGDIKIKKNEEAIYYNRFHDDVIPTDLEIILMLLQ